MRIAVLAVGSRGDVQPLVALAAGLRSAGHDVTLATSPVHARLVHGAGVAFVPLEGDPNDLMAAAQSRAWQAAGHNPARFRTSLGELVRPLADQLLEDSWAACEDAEALVWTPLSPIGYHLAEALGIPGLLAALQPLTPNTEFVCPPLPRLPLPRLLAASYNAGAPRVVEQAAWLLFRSMASQWRARLGLAPASLRSPYARMRAQGAPVLYGFSSRVVPKPASWGEEQLITGYWFHDGGSQWRPARALERFLAAGSAPIGITFGGMAGGTAARALGAALEALGFSGERAVVIGGDLDRVPAALLDHVFPLAEVPHDWLFPQLSMVVHHGGAGTTAAALRAGVPSVVVPFFADQPFWGHRVHRIGAGPRPVPARRVSPADLVAAFDKALHDPSVRAHAALAGRLLSAEDGVQNAVLAIEQVTMAGVDVGAQSAPRAVSEM
jgi:UDP:flavonoid glycosyltransferase YjiC (YdhE family)